MAGDDDDTLFEIGKDGRNERRMRENEISTRSTYT